MGSIEGGGGLFYIRVCVVLPYPFCTNIFLSPPFFGLAELLKEDYVCRGMERKVCRHLDMWEVGALGVILHSNECPFK